MCGDRRSRRRNPTLTAGQRSIETATQVQAYLVEKLDDIQSGLDSVENELPPVYTEVWNEKSQAAQDAVYEPRGQAGQSGDVKDQQASVSGYDSKITTAARGTY